MGEFASTVVYVVIARFLRDALHFRRHKDRYSNVVAVLGIVPVCTAINASLYCAILYFSGALPFDRLAEGVRNFWIGDTLGIVVVIPAAIALRDILSDQGLRQLLRPRLVVLSGVAMAPVVGTVLLVASGNERHHLFYLLFLPTIWVSINYGYNAAAALILAIQVCLIAALTGFQVDDSQFIAFQTLMFILAATGLLLGAVVTEREETTRLLRHHQARLARVSAQASAGAMALSVTHEISQPLASLSTYVHCARRLIAAGGSEPQVLNALGQAEAQANRTRAIIERIRDFVSSGRLELRDVDVAEIARKIVALNAEVAAAEGVTLTVEGADEELIVQADATAIEQALNNLVANAIESASTLKKRDGHVLVRMEPRGDRVRPQRGRRRPGVAPDIADKLFEAFETTKSRGMGLGLPLTRQIVERHSGRLDWSPREPRGARFFIELPIHGPEFRAA